MKPDKERDITERMVEMLKKHSQPYEEGAWERFKEYEARKKPKIVFWPYLSGAAAIVLLGVVLFLNPDNFGTQPTPTVVQTTVPTEPIQPELEPETDARDAREKEKSLLADVNVGAESSNVQEIAQVIPKANLRRGQQDQPYSAAVHQPQENYSAETQTQPVDESPETAVSPQQKEETQAFAQSNRTYDQERAYQNGDWMRNDNPEGHSDLNQHSNRWDFSIELAPNINERQQVNFGGGVAVAYNINEKISISSGISYVQLDAQRGPNNVDIPAEFAKTSLSSYNYNKSLNTINTTLVGLDIPVNLKVDLGSQIYASAGVSVFSVLSESRYNIFEEKRTQLASVASDGRVNPEPAIQTVYSQEVSPNSPYEGKNFTGFFNLSVGYKLPVLKDLNLAVEPYLKIPVGSLTSQDMNLGNGGVKIVTSF